MLTTQLDTVDQLTDSLVNDQSSLKHTVATPNHRNVESVLRKNRRGRDACSTKYNGMYAISFLISFRPKSLCQYAWVLFIPKSFRVPRWIERCLKRSENRPEKNNGQASGSNDVEHLLIFCSEFLHVCVTLVRRWAVCLDYQNWYRHSFPRDIIRCITIKDAHI